MAKRVSVTERVMEERSGGHHPETIGKGTSKEDNGARGATTSKQVDGRSAEQESGDLVEATFLLDRESVEILERIALRHEKRDGDSKSVSEAIPWFRAKPGNWMEQVLREVSSVIGRAVVKERGATRATMARLVTPVLTIVGSLFMGGALWLAQGGQSGGDAMGISILGTLGVTLILLGVGTALTFVVAHLLGLPSTEATGEAAPSQEQRDAQSIATLWSDRPKRTRRSKSPARR
jgi:hypothetical protein